MPGRQIFFKAPPDVLDFVFDFKPRSHAQPGAKSDWLAADEVITGHAVSAEGGLGVESSSELDGAVTVWLSGGSPGWRRVFCQIVTSAGRVARRALVVRVE